MEEFQEQFNEMHKQIWALHGKELFGKDAHKLCLVPDVRVPPKFKVPEFEIQGKYFSTKPSGNVREENVYAN